MKHYLSKSLASKNSVHVNNVASRIEVHTDHSLPFDPVNLDMVREAVGGRADAEPNELFEKLVLNKKVCPRRMLKEMFHLDDYCLRQVFFEGRRLYDRGLRFDTLAHQVVRLTIGRDLKPISFTTSQVKLRALLAKRLDWVAYDMLMQDLDEAYNLHYEDYFYYGDGVEVMEACNISEEELLDALQTYQAEHKTVCNL